MSGLEERRNRILRWLNDPLPAEAIKEHPHNGLSYIPTEAAIDRANHIFGNLGWSMTSDTKLHSVTQVDKNGKPMFEAIACSTVTVTVDGDLGPITRAGSKSADGYSKTAADAVVVALASAESEALRRAFRTFGHGLGNGLYQDGSRVGTLPGRLKPWHQLCNESTSILALAAEGEAKQAIEILRDHKAISSDDKNEISYRIKRGIFK